ncbi:MAG: hypothetical protein QXP27_06150 [Candidatus Methanomethyliaceae archaeon]
MDSYPTPSRFPKIAPFLGAAIVVLAACLPGNNLSVSRAPGEIVPMQERSTPAPVLSPTGTQAKACTDIPETFYDRGVRFFLLSDDQVQLWAGLEGETRLRVQYRFPDPIRANVRFYPPGFPAISRDGYWVTVVENRKTGDNYIGCIELAATEMVPLVNWRDSIYEAVISPDGTRVAFIANEHEETHVYVMGSNTYNMKRLTQYSAPRCFLAWSPDSTRITYQEECDPVSISEIGPKVYVAILDSSNNAKMMQLTGSGYALSWSPDGEWLLWQPFPLYGGEYGPARLSRLNAAGEIVEEIASGLGSRAGMWSPDSRKLAAIDGGNIVTWDIESGAIVTTPLEIPDLVISAPTKWLCDGRLLFSGYRESSGYQSRRWFTVNADGTHLIEYDAP